MPSMLHRAKVRILDRQNLSSPSLWAALVLLALAILIATSPGCSEDPAAPENPQVLESFEVRVPDWVRANTGFPLVIEAVGSQGTKPLPYATGTVQLSASQGAVSPTSAVLTQGKATVNAMLSGSLGSVTITATQGAIGGSGIILTVSPDSIGGSASDDAADAVPNMAYFPRAADFSTGHADLPGAYVSHNTISIAFALGTTVGEANKVLDDISGAIVGGMKGVPGQVEGVVIARLSTLSHATLQPVLTSLESNGSVESVFPDITVRTGRVSVPNDVRVPFDWMWDPTPLGGNWGLELIRVPQMWNLTDAVRRTAPRAAVGIVDYGFPAHVDLEYTTPGSPVADHGGMVAGIIGAAFNNRWGIDGINPLFDSQASTDMTTAEINPISLSGAVYHSAIDNIQTFRDLAALHPAIEVVNWSVYYGWCESGINVATNTDAQSTARRHGEALKRAFRYLRSVNSKAPIVVSIAGNGSDGGCGIEEASFASPCNNAALDNAAPTAPEAAIIVVEALERNGSAEGGAQRASFSNTGGHVSAPGVCIRSTASQRPNPPADATCDIDGIYKSDSGTSFAAPHVTGVISFMLAVDPTLTPSEIRDILSARGVAVAGGAANRIDAWGSVLDIDRVRGSDAVLRMLVDLDDGTPDGNQRVDSTGAWVLFDAQGDGHVDMSDFRRWRDWYLQIENDPTLRLDGGFHPKKDPNLNLVPQEGLDENLYPRGDLNGDGKIDLYETSFVPGALNASLSDLEVLQSVFSDARYDASELFNLVHSGDVTITPAGCFDPSSPDIVANGYQVVSTATPVGSPTPLMEIIHSSALPSEVITLAPGPYQIAVEVRDPVSGDIISTEARPVSVILGSDAFVQVGVDQDCVRPVPIRHVEQIRFSDYEFTASPGNHGLANLGDVDGDGVVDLALIRTSKRFNNQRTVWILFLNQDGTLKTHAGIELTDLGYDPELEAPFKSVSGIGDADGDGIRDIAVGVFDDEVSGAMWLVFLNADGTVKGSRKILGTELNCPPCARGGGTNWPAPVGDLDGDGAGDIMVPWGSNEGRDRMVGLFLDGVGGLKSSAEWGWLSVRDNPIAATGDIDTDGNGDVAYAWEDFYSFLKITYLNDDGTEKASEDILSWAADEIISSIGSGGDLDGDSATDILVTTYSDDRGSKVWAVLLNSDGSFRERLTISHAGFGLIWGAAFVGDLDGDGLDDVGLLDMLASAPDFVWILFPENL